MANVRYVDPDSTAGGDGTTNALTGANRAYVSLNAWEAARQAVLSDVEECICESSHANHTADTTAVVITGWTTTATNHISIKTSAGARHAGVWSNSKYRLYVVNATALTISEDYVRIEGLQIGKSSVSSSDRMAIEIFGQGTSDIRLSHFITRHASDVFRQSGIYVQDADALVKIWNWLDYGHPDIASVYNSGLIVEASATVYIYSSTVIGGHIGVNAQVAGAVINAKNVYASCNSTSGAPLGFGGAGTINQTTCASFDATATGTGLDNIAVNTTNFTNVTAGSEDFHIPSGSALKDVGTDLSADATIAFSTDIDGETRSGTWDVGADELVAGGGGQTVSPSGIASLEAFGTAKINQQIRPTGIASAEVVPSPRINQQIRPGGITSAEAFGTPTISVGSLPSQTISPPSIVSGEAFGTAKVNQQIRPSGIPSQENIPSPRVNQQIRPPSITSLEAFGTAKVNQQIRPGILVPQDVTWTNVVGATNVANTLTKTGADGWDAGAISNQSIQSGSGYLEFSPAQTNKHIMLGFGDSVDAGQSFEELKWAFHTDVLGDLYIQENGVLVHDPGVSYLITDILRIEIFNGAVLYKRNGVTIYTSAIAPTYPLFVDMSLYSTGAVVSGVKIATVVDSGIGSLEMFGVPIISIGPPPPQTILPVGIASLETFGVPWVNQHIFVTTGIPSGEAFGTPTISLGTPFVWTSFGAPFLYTYSNWLQPADFYLEAFFKSDAGGVVKARLFNVTDSVAVLNSEIQTTNTNYERVRGGSLSLIDGKEYRVQFGSAPGVTGAFKMAKLLQF